MTERTAFMEALEIADEHQRSEFLDRACGGDAQMRASVEELLKAHSGPGPFMERPAPSLATDIDETPSVERPGAMVGPYRLIEQIGEGGMGIVFVAEQVQPLRRHVALKVIKPGMDSKQVVARFEAERQALALMDHPNIARVLDAGTTDAGRPFFVMELVRGIPISAFCDQARLVLRQRLELFVQVCRAVQHAHTKGIIHRDLKPPNVLVTSHDGIPVPKIIDFGVAKALQQQLTSQAVYTGVAQMIGTPLYMSPEQVEFNDLGVDTRSDIYTLGVMLYELLSGVTPFDEERLRTVGFDEIRRIIREEEPPRPSNRLSTLGAALDTVAERRAVDPRRLRETLHGELDWIVLKALEKDRTRRYETASVFAADIQRYLDDDVVEACPPSRSYRLWKFAKRNRAPLMSAAAVLVVLAGGFAGTALGLLEAQAERDRAILAEKSEIQERIRAEGERDRAKKAEKEAKAREKDASDLAAEKNAILEFFQKNVLAAARPKDQNGGLGHEATIRAALDATESEIASAFQGQPMVEAAIRNSMGASYWYLGEAKLAIAHYERALNLRRENLGARHPDTLTVMSNLANAYRTAGRFNDAVKLHEETLKLRQYALGPKHPDTLISMNNLASALQSAGRLDDALLLLEETLLLQKAELGPEHIDTRTSMNNLARAYQRVGRLKEALTLYEKTLALQKALLGPVHQHTLTSMSNLAMAYRDAGRLNDAQKLLEETLTLRKANLGPEHPDTLTSMCNLGTAYRTLGRFDDAVALLEETLSLQKSKLGQGHPDTWITMNMLGAAYRDNGRLADALPLFQEALVQFRANLGTDHSETLDIMSNLADCYDSLLQPAQAESLWRELASIWKKKAGPDSIKYASYLAGLGNNLLVQLNWTDAEAALRECLTIRETKQPDEWFTFNTRSVLGGALLGQKKYAEAEPLLLQGYEGMKQRAAKMHPRARIRLTETQERLVELYNAIGRQDEAAKWRQKLEKKLPLRVRQPGDKVRL
jgi:eukaryotic-like serine/threonine-protein kinase